jgi:hypothetical protein
MPGIFGAIVSAIAIALSSGKGFGADYFGAGTITSQFWA